MRINSDIVIIGSGPAGLQAALHSGKICNVLVVGKLEDSKLWQAKKIDNYMGIKFPVSGKELLSETKRQLLDIGVNFVEDEVVSIEKDTDKFSVTLSSQDVVETKAVIFACGVKQQQLGVKGERDFVGRGVSYCVDCDCMFFRNKKVAVVGDGSAAKRAVDILTKIASSVVWIIEDISKIGSDIEKSESFSVKEGRIVELVGKDYLERIIFDDGASLDVDGIFIELGARGAVELAMEVGVFLDEVEMKYIKIDKMCRTNVEGIFAAGDVTGVPFQLAKAVGEGCIAGFFCAEWVRKSNNT